MRLLHNHFKYSLFLIFINDILSSTQNLIHSFADDSTLFSIDLCRSHSLNDVLQAREDLALSINSDLELINLWASSYLVELYLRLKLVCTSTINFEFVNFIAMRLSKSLLWHNNIGEAAKKHLVE